MREDKMYGLHIRVPYDADFAFLPPVTTAKFQSFDSIEVIGPTNYDKLSDWQKEFHTSIDGLSIDDLRAIKNVIDKILIAE